MATLVSRFRSLVNIHADESRMASLVIGVMLLTSAGFTLGSKGVETLFYTRFGVEYLPYMFLLSGILSFLISLGVTALLGRVRRENLYILVPLGVAILTLVAWTALFSTWNLVYPVLWLGKEVVNSLVSLVIWGIASTVCDTRQSKRLFPLFNAGRILGAVIGGFGTGLLVNQIGTQNLLLVWAGMLLLAFALIRTLLSGRVPTEPARQTRRKQKRSSLLQEMQHGFQFVRGSTLMRWISLAAILFSILYRCIDLPFAKAATTQFSMDEKALAGFLGLFEGLSTAAAFLVSTFIANRLYARIGIMHAILALPIIYIVGFASITLSNAFAVILAFRFFQMLWLSSVADSAYQAMFNVVPAARRDQVRAFIGGVPEQAGTFLAGLVTIVFLPHQLTVVGLISAMITTFIIWRASRAYNVALVDSLRKGRPTLFSEQSRPDAAAVHAALEGMKNPEPMIRRVSTQIVSTHSSATDALVHALFDEDIDVRISALKGLARLQATAALIDIASLLSDPQPALRAHTIDALRALTPHPRGLRVLLTPLLNDADARVQVRAMVALLSMDPSHPSRNQLRKMAMTGNVDARILALEALSEVGDPDALMLFTMELKDEDAPVAVRCAAVSALATCGVQAIHELIHALASKNLAVKSRAASALGRISEPALPEVLNALTEPESEYGALLALEHLPAWKEAEKIRVYARTRVESSIRFEDLRLSIQGLDDERMRLLSDSLQHRARRDGINSMMALALLHDREFFSTVIDNLKSRNTAQYPNALESLDSVRDAALIRPTFRLWESIPVAPPLKTAEQVIAELIDEKDDWLRACANFAKEQSMETLTTLSSMERVLLLRRVSLLTALIPADLQRVAAIATEQEFVDGDVLCEQGEAGNEMYVILSGEVRVVTRNEGQTEKEIARRRAGDVVGEMSLISGDTRIATLIAVGDVRALCLDRLSFESLLRERPEVSLAVMRELCNRLKERS